MEQVSAKEVPGIHQGLHAGQSETPVTCPHMLHNLADLGWESANY